MFDITAKHRKTIYQFLDQGAGVLGSILAAMTALMPLIPTDVEWAWVVTGAASILSFLVKYVGKMAADHTVVDELIDAVDSVPGN